VAPEGVCVPMKVPLLLGALALLLLAPAASATVLAPTGGICLPNGECPVCMYYDPNNSGGVGVYPGSGVVILVPWPGGQGYIYVDSPFATCDSWIKT
jgi:hypothetical protein